jgi:hypothetical protein
LKDLLAWVKGRDIYKINEDGEYIYLQMLLWNLFVWVWMEWMELREELGWEGGYKL